MKSSITIIIPTHERHKLLHRAIDYYSQLNILVLIVDSSETFFKKELPEKINYIHLPGWGMGDKINVAIRKVKTPFSCLCADDDFLAENALKAGQKFLEENLDYVSVQGHCVQFDPINPLAQYNPIYTNNIGYRNDSNSINDRVLDVPRCPHIYALHRSNIHKKSMSVLLNIPALTMVELIPCMIAMCYGKHAVLPIFWMARDVRRYSQYCTEDGNAYSYNNPSDPFEIIELNKVVVDVGEYVFNSSEGLKCRENFIKVVSDVIPDYSKAEELFNLSIKNYISIFNTKRNSSPKNNFLKIIKSFLKIIKSFLPFSFVAKLHLIRRSKLRHAQKGVSGYPWSDDISKKDWSSMAKVILKFKDIL